MAWLIVGLGNPGDEYVKTRHNAGRLAVDYFIKKMEFTEWKEDKKSKAHVSRGLLGKTIVAVIAPDTFMNKSGLSVSKFVKSPKAAERMVVVYDDLDLPIGKIKLSFDRGSGGHKGLESVMAAVKTKKFARIRIGVSPETPGGKLKKPEGKKVVNTFILDKFKDREMDELKDIFKKVADALKEIVAEGPAIAMNHFN